MRMNLQRWHPGQFATAIVGGLVIEWLLVARINYLMDMYDTEGTVALLLLPAVILAIAMLWLSWNWFGSRLRN